MNLLELKISEVKPYDKNPRKNDVSVDKVANSIKEFGFKVPIVLDKNNVIVCGHTRMDEENKVNLKEIKKQLPTYSYPAEVLTASALAYLTKHGVEYEIEAKDTYHIRAMDAQTEKGKAVFGGGFLISEKAAAEKADVNIWELSEREKQIIKSLG